jgi:hypothetical protein
MKKTVFVLGDSYCHHDYVPYDSSWPALLTDIDHNLKVINGAIPGSSLDSMFYRYLQMEREFGKPDLTLITLSHLGRIWFMANRQNLLNLEKIKDRYYATIDTYITHMVPNGFGNKSWEQELELNTGHSIKTLKTVFNALSSENHQWWRTIKEIHLLNSYCSNPVFMSWHEDLSDTLESVNIKFIGTAIDFLGDNLANCIPAEHDYHLTEYGHAQFAPVIYEKIKSYF